MAITSQTAAAGGGDDLHVGLILPNYGPALDRESLARSAIAAEDAGFDSAWVTDHLMVPSAHADVYGTIAEPLVSLGFLAARTHRLQLGVSALIVPARNPLVVLKQLTSLDFLSGGRIVTAVAPGWLEEEFGSLRAPFERRGRVLDEWLELAADVFRQMPGPVDHDGELALRDAWFAPALVRPGGIEFWIAGTSRAAIRRAATTGVWHPVALTPDALRPLADDLRRRRPDARVVLRIGAHFASEPKREAVDERRRPLVAGPSEWIAERLGEYVEAGCDGFTLDLKVMEDGLDDRVSRFASEVVPLLARARAKR